MGYKIFKLHLKFKKYKVDFSLFVCCSLFIIVLLYFKMFVTSDIQIQISILAV